MPSLLEIQRAFRAVLLDADAPPPSWIVDCAPGAAARLGIYRDNVRANLTAALRLAFPATLRLVGADFFAAAAARFIADAPPRDADLYRYGAGLPAFLVAFPPAAALPWLGDVAKLDWAVNHALHAPDGPPIDLSTLAAADAAELRLAPMPSLSLLETSTPARAIWQATMTDDADARAAALAALDPAAPGESLAVLRSDAGLAILVLPPQAHALARRLVAGMPMANALAPLPGHEAPALLASLFANALFTEPAR